MKRVIQGFLNGFCYSIAITMVIQLLVLFSGNMPMLPDFAARFDNSLTAFAVQLVLVGLMSGTTSAGTVVFELKKIGILAQSLIFLLIMLAAWIPVAYIAWGFGKYAVSMVITVMSLVVSYGICWWIQYRLCRKEIEAINILLGNRKGE